MGMTFDKQLFKIVPVVMFFLVLALLLAISINVLTDMEHSEFVNATTAYTNQSITATNASYVTLYGEYLDTSVPLKVVNDSGINVTSANYTVRYSPPGFILDGDNVFQGETLNVSFTYINTTRGPMADPAANGSEGLSKLGEWLPTIALIIIASIIIFLVMMAFRFGKRS